MADQLQLWLPCVILSHAFSCLWLLRAWLRTRTQRHRVNPRQASCSQPDVNVELAVEAVAGWSAVVQSDTSNCTQDAAAAEQTIASTHQAAGGQACLLIQLSSSEGAGHPQPKGVALEWQALACCYNIGGVVKVVLQDVSGKAQPGQMQALMGPSGAGKSTLMDMLAMRKSVGTLTGQLLVDGSPATTSFIRRTSYVPQEDTFVPTMSTQETLTFYAGVVLGDGWSRAARKARVTQALTAMGLGHTGETLVGGTLPGGLNLRGLSGGERRRLSIAAGILGAPPVLFLDEPTSGLDSFAALSVMGHLQDLARGNQQTIIATIHQPRSAIWEMFDTVSLLATGRLMFHGPCADMVPWFQSLGYTYTHGSESDWVLDLVATGFAKPQHLFGHTLRSKKDVDQAADLFKSRYEQDKVCGIGVNSSISGDTDNIKDVTVILPAEPLEDKADGILGDKLTGVWGRKVGSSSSYPTGWWRQFSVLFGRELAGMTRNPFDVAARMLTGTYVALLFALFAYKSNLQSMQGVQATVNYMFACIMNAMLLPYISISLYTSDKKLYLADASAKLYRPSAYYVAKVMAGLPFGIVYMLSYSGVWYGMGGLRAGGSHFGAFFCIIALLNLIGNQVLHLCAVLAPNLDTTFAFSVSWTTLQFPTCSFLIPFSLVYLHGLTALRYISAAYFALEALVTNELSGREVDCSNGIGAELVDTLTTGFVNASAFQKAAINQLKQPQPGCVFEESAVLKLMDFTRPFHVSVGILLGYLGVLHVLTYCALLLVARRERR